MDTGLKDALALTLFPTPKAVAMTNLLRYIRLCPSRRNIARCWDWTVDGNISG